MRRGGSRLVWGSVIIATVALWLIGSLLFFRQTEDAIAAVVSISGTVYNSDESTANTSGPTVRVKVNGGGTYSATASAVNGTFTVSSVTLNAGDSLVVYLDTGGGISGATYTRATGSNMTGIDVYRDTLATRCDNSSCSLANTDIDYWDKGNDSDIHATVTSGALTVDADWKLLVKANTYTPGGSVTAPGVSLKATFEPGANTITLNGGGTNTSCTSAVTAMMPLCISGGTLTAGSSTIKFTGNNTAVVGTTYNNLTVGGGTTLARTGAITASSGENYFYSGVADSANDYSYYGTFTAPGKVVKVRLSDGTRVGALNFNSGENYPIEAAVIDTVNGYAYFGTDDSTGEVVKVRLSDFTRNAVLNFSAGEGKVMSGVVDSAGGYAYFGTNDSPAKIVKVQLSDFTRVGSITLNSGENIAQSAVIDPSGGYAYFGLDTSPQKVVKIRLSDFTRNNVLTFNTGENGARNAEIDLSNGFAYFTDFSSPTKIIKVQLSDFTRVTALALNTSEVINNNATAIDVKRGYFYGATNQSPLRLVKVQLSDFTRLTGVDASSGENTAISLTLDTVRGNLGAGTFAAPSKVITYNTVSAHTLGSAGSQTITTNGTFTVDGYANADSNDPVLDIASSSTINSVGYLVASSTSNYSVAGNFVNNGRFSHSNGTIIFDGASEQDISGTLTGDDSFYNLTITNSSGADDPGCGTSFTPSVDFAGSVKVSNNYTITTASVRVEYNSGSTYTFNNINWNGQASGTRIFFRNSNLSSGSWSLVVTGTQTAVSYVNVARSDASGGDEIAATDFTSVDCGNNTNWNILTGYTISGTVYLDDETTAYSGGSPPTVRVKVDGTGDYSTTASGVNGTYSISGVTMSAGNPLTIYLDTGGAMLGATFTVSTGANMSNVHIYEDRATLRCDNSCSLTNANINKWDKDDDSDIHAAVNVTSLTVDSDWKLLVVNNTYAPGGTVTTSAGGSNGYSGDIEVKAGATFNVASNALSIGGSFINSGTFTATNTTTFASTTTGQTISGSLTGANGFSTLVFDGTLGDWSISNDLEATSLTITNGSVTAPSGTLTLNAGYSNSGTFTHNSGTISFEDAGGSNNIAGSMTGSNSFYNVVFNTSATYTFTSSATIANDLTITSGTVVAPSATLTINGDYSNAGTFTNSSGSVVLAGSAKQIFSGTMTGTSAFNNLTITNSSGTADPGCGTSFTPSVDFAASATVGGTFTATTASTKIEFESGATYTFGSMTLNGQGAGTMIQLRNSNLAAGTWDLVLSGTESVSYVDVARSNANGGDFVYAGNGTNEDCSINSNWIFSAPDTPSSLAQKKNDDTNLSVGQWINETTVKFTANASDAFSGSQLQLCVEKDVLATSFSNSEDLCGDAQTYTSSPVSVTVTLTGLADASEYHWQVRTKNQYGGYSIWQAFGANAESARDFGIDTTAPTTGTVSDGEAGDVEFNDGSLTELKANWSGFSADVSGVSYYEYSIGTTAGGTDIKNWTNNSTNTSVTATSLVLNTGARYYFNVRLADNAGNTSSVVSSNGQDVLPQISFALSANSIVFDGLQSSNNRQDTKTVTTTTSTNAYGGYVIRAYKSGLLTSGAVTIPDFAAGSYASPAAWGSGFCSGSSCGFGYTTSDTSISGVNKFSSGTLYAPFSSIAPGDIVADHTTNITGTTGALVNDAHTITAKVAVDALQGALSYTSTLYFIVTGTF